MSKKSKREPRSVMLKYPELWTRKFRNGLGPGYEAQKGEGTVEALLSRCQELGPCVLLLDSDSARAYKAHEATGFTSADSENVNVLIVENGPVNLETMREFLSAGSKGVLNHRASSATIGRAVSALWEGELWAPRQVLSSLLQMCLFQLGPNALTEREQDILELIGRGLTNREIAEKLFISRETVRWHIRGVYSKIGASDRLAAAIYAKEVLLLPKDSPKPAPIRQPRPPNSPDPSGVTRHDS